MDDSPARKHSLHADAVHKQQTRPSLKAACMAGPIVSTQPVHSHSPQLWRSAQSGPQNRCCTFFCSLRPYLESSARAASLRGVCNTNDAQRIMAPGWNARDSNHGVYCEMSIKTIRYVLDGLCRFFSLKAYCIATCNSFARQPLKASLYPLSPSYSLILQPLIRPFFISKLRLTH